MKLNSLVCLKNNHLVPLIDGLEESPVLAVSVVNDFSEFQRDFNNYNLNYLLCLLTGNPELKDKENTSIKFMLQKIKENHPSIPLEEEKKLLEETRTLCENNMDVFDKFYAENEGLITDISDRVLSLRKTGYFKFKRKDS